MNIQQAKEILSSTQWKDQEDPLVKEAMELAGEHQELKDLLEEQKLLDPLIASALNEVAVPGNLEQLLLDSVKPNRERRKPGIRKAIWGLGIAAIVCFGLGSTFLLQNESAIQAIQSKFSGKKYSDMAEFRDGMAYFISGVYFKLDHVTEDLGSIESWLVDKKVPSFEELPESLARLNPIGCKELAWNNKKVSLVCFHSKEGKIVHMFIMERKDGNQQFEDITTVAVSHGLETGGWLTNEKVYLLVGSDSDVDIEFALI